MTSENTHIGNKSLKAPIFKNPKNKPMFWRDFHQNDIKVELKLDSWMDVLELKQPNHEKSLINIMIINSNFSSTRKRCKGNGAYKH